jgi:hypothetical protein
MFSAKPKVSVSQNLAKNSGPKFRLLISDSIREKFDFDFCSPGRIWIFCFSFLASLGLEPMAFRAESPQRRPMYQAAN